jgi:hypothetical protein
MKDGAKQLRLTSGFTTLTSFDMDYRVRSIVFAAGWFAAHATRKIDLLIVAFAVSFSSGKNNGVNPLNCLLNVKRYFFLSHRSTSTR